MEKTQTPLSAKRIYRIKCQGFSGYNDEEITQLAFANRFPVIICLIILGVGVALASIPLLTVLLVVSILSIVLPYHVFDYIYNHWLRHKMNKPKLAPRPNQLKFACFLAATWTAVNIYLFSTGHMTAGYISGAIMFCVPLLVSTIDLCIPSMIYNFLFGVKIR